MFPRNVEGVLKFEAHEQWEAFDRHLRLALDESSEDNPSEISSEDLMTSIEKKLKFNSLLSLEDRLVEAALESGVSPQNIVGRTPFAYLDPCMQLILTVQGEIWIGESLHVFEPSGNAYIFPKATKELLEEIRQKGVRGTLPTSNYQHQSYPSNNEEIYYGTTPSPCSLDVSATRDSFPCNNLGYKFNCKFNDADDLIVLAPNYEIDFGDGTSDNGQGGNFYHTYQSAGKYTVVVRAEDLTEPLCMDVASLELTIVDTICVKDKVHKKSYKVVGNKVVIGEVWVYPEGGFPFIWPKRIVAQSSFYRKISGTWKKRNADKVAVQVWAGLFFDECVNFKEVLMSKWEINSQKARRNKAISGDWGYRNDTIKVDFRAKYEGVWYQGLFHVDARC